MELYIARTSSSKQLPAVEMLMREMKTGPVLGMGFNTYALVLGMLTFHQVLIAQPGSEFSSRSF